MQGLCPGSQKVRPTGRMIFYHPSDPRLRIGSATDPHVIAVTRGIQLHLLDLLGLEPTHPAGRTPERTTREVRGYSSHSSASSPTSCFCRFRTSSGVHSVCWSTWVVSAKGTTPFRPAK